MKVAIHQPQYWPWIPYFHKILSADLFVILDDVQFQKNGVQNRNQVKGPNGAIWLTLPVSQNLEQRISEARVSDRRAIGKHLKSLQGAYAKAPGWERSKTSLSEFFSREEERLEPLAVESIRWSLRAMEVEIPMVRASELKGVTGEKSERVASICREVGAKEYLCGRGGFSYLIPEQFEKIDCRIRIQTWNPFEYCQQFPALGFLPDLSALDLILNCPETARAQIQKAGGWE